MGVGNISSRLLRKKLSERRGSQIVEAAIFLPVLMIAVLSLSSIMGYIKAADSINDSLVKEAQVAGVSAHFIPLSLAGAELSWQAGRVKSDYYLLTQKDVGVMENDTILLTADYAVVNRLPLDFIGARQIRQKIWVRAFIGSERPLSAMPWADMETDADSEPVFVFPRAGEKYHEGSCIFVDNTPVETILSDSLAKRYSPCKICDAKAAPDYSLVYCFSAAGEAYHIAGCPLVDKYVIEMDEKDAMKKGYTPCKKCR